MEHEEWQTLHPELLNEYEFHSSLASSTITPIPEPWPFSDGHAAFHGSGVSGTARVCFGMVSRSFSSLISSFLSLLFLIYNMR
jgi:hypothetical protein